MGFKTRLISLISCAGLAAALAVSFAQPARANTSWLEVNACPRGVSVLAVEDDPTLPAPRVDWTIPALNLGAEANLVGRVSGPGVPGGQGTQYVYWSEVELPPGAAGSVVASGARNQSYANFTVAEDCPPLGSVRGSAFEDLNANGRRDPGEPGIGTASWKVTAGGDWFICGYVGGDSTYGPTVTPGTYTVIPIAQPGWRATTPPLTAVVKQLGFAALDNDIGFARATSPGDTCGQYAPPSVPQPGPDVVAAPAALAGHGGFNTLLAAAQAAGLIDALAGPGPYTLLAPTDAAFARLTPARLNALLRHPAQLAELLKCHVIPSAVDPAQLTGARGRTYRTLGSRSVTLRVDRRGQLFANNVAVGAAVDAGNGSIFALDRVLFVR